MSERDSPDISDSPGKLIMDVRMGRRMHHAEFDASSHPRWFDVIVRIAMSLSDQAMATTERDSHDISEAAVAELVATMQLAYGPTNGYIEKVVRPIVALRAALTKAEQAPQLTAEQWDEVENGLSLSATDSREREVTWRGRPREKRYRQEAERAEAVLAVVRDARKAKG